VNKYQASKTREREARTFEMILTKFIPTIYKCKLLTVHGVKDDRLV
jgi:hypothetical protein